FICPTQCTWQQTEDVVSLSRFARPPCWPIRMQVHGELFAHENLIIGIGRVLHAGSAARKRAGSFVMTARTPNSASRRRRAGLSKVQTTHGKPAACAAMIVRCVASV